jgi:parallel beta-helix repeat protein
MRRFPIALLSLAMLSAAQAVMAATYYVGTCKSGAYTTIQSAVSSVPAGSTIKVCPGTYAEQVIISQPLTLEGITSSNSSEAFIAMPSAGLTTTTSITEGTLAPQVWASVGPVNITGITIDGTATSSNCPSTPPFPWYVGIFYSSGASGTLKGLEVQNQNCNGTGTGIIIENGSGTNESVTIENSSVVNDTAGGILAWTYPTSPTLSATIKNNYVSTQNAAINVGNTSGSVSNNYLTGGFDGVFANSGLSTITGNTIVGESFGVSVETTSVVVSSNTISNSTYSGIIVDGGITGAILESNQISNSGNEGIFLNGGDATIKSNTLFGNPIGIEFRCTTGNTVSGNTINGSSTGFDSFPAGTVSGNFYNVVTITTGCDSDANSRNVRPAD